MASGRQLYNLEPLRGFIDRDYQLITPNARLARRIKYEWDEEQKDAGRVAWAPLRVAPLEQWLLEQWQRAADESRLPALRLLGQEANLLLWQRVIESDSSMSGLSLLQPAAAAKQAADARDTLLRWRLNPASGSAQREFLSDPDCRVFLRWLLEFESRMQRAGYGTAADRLTALIEAKPSVRVPSPILLIDVDEIMPLQAACLESVAGIQEEYRSAGDTATVSLLPCKNREGELEEAAAWSARQVACDAEATLGIVLVDMATDRLSLEYLLRREFDCLGEDYASLPVNFSTGITLNRAPVVATALRMLDTVVGPVPLAAVAALLQTRFSRQTDGQSDLAVRLMSRLSADGRADVSLSRLRFLAAESLTEEGQALALGSILRQVAGLRLTGRSSLPSEWLEHICEVLDLWGWPGYEPLDSLEYQQVERWYELLERFAGLDDVLGRMNFAQMLKALRFCSQRAISQPQTRESRVQVLGPIEAAGLKFDKLWLCGVQASNWPPTPRPNPFIPQPLQRQYDLPRATAEREWRFVEQLTAQFLWGASEVIASYSVETDGVPELPSPLVRDWPRTAQPEATADPVAPHWLAVREAHTLGPALPDNAPVVGADEAARLGGGSGLLEDQANCPFRAFARRRLKVTPLSEPSVGLTAAERGSLLHSALYILWGELGDSRALGQMDTDALQSLAAGSAGQALSEDRRVRERVDKPLLDLEEQRLSRLLQQWLALERARTPFRVRAREAPASVELAGLNLKLQVDRIDELEGGQVLVIDYKSSVNSLSHWLGERPRAPQLPLYGLAHRDVSGLAWAEVRPRDGGFRGLGTFGGVDGVKEDLKKALRSPGSPEDWEALEREWHTTLSALAQAFMNGEAGVDPLSGACQYCGLESFCRVGMAHETA
ncbi:MAG: PD-(D/E)XK nuclease family protein [Pseudomonadota bacterium]